MRVKKLPMILALHLKRFKYMEQLQRYTKLSYRVVFPLELRLFNTSGDATNPERLYDLVAVVVHCGRCVEAATQQEGDLHFDLCSKKDKYECETSVGQIRSLVILPEVQTLTVNTDLFSFSPPAVRTEDTTLPS